MFSLEKVISGGQTGADLAGVDAALLYNLETGGWMPKYFRNLTGFHQEYKELYNMKEHSSKGYKERTEDNVFDSDATVRFFFKKNSAGERCTFNAIRLHGKPYFDVDFNEVMKQANLWQHERGDSPTARALYKWLCEKEIKTLNVAGNSEQTHMGMYDATFSFLTGVFEYAGLEQQV